MKTLIIFILLTGNALAVCLSPLSRTNINAGVIPTSAKYNADFNDLYDRINNLPGDCIADNSIGEDQFPDGAITEEKIANATITAAKFAAGVIPPMAKPLRIKAYTSSGKWIRQPDVGRIFVQLVGAGGGVYHENSSASEFAPDPFGYISGKCFGGAGGRNHAPSGSYGLGGFAANGNILIFGENARNNRFSGGGGRPSLLGPFGQGGSVVGSLEGGDIVKSGGGGGGYCAVMLEASALRAEEVVTVGMPGADLTPSSTIKGRSGKQGLVLIYEYGK